MVSDFDFARKLLTIRAETTKNRSGKVVPYSLATSALLGRCHNRRRTMRCEPDADYLVYLDQGGRTYGSAQ
jgi:hypothetical protein